MREKHEGRHGLYVELLFFAGKPVEHLSGVPLWRNPHQTVVNRGHGACSVLLSHRTGVVCVPLCDPLLLRIVSCCPGSCHFPQTAGQSWSVPNEAAGSSVFLNLMKSKTAFVYLMNTTSKQSAWNFFHPLEIHLPAHPGATFG